MSAPAVDPRRLLAELDALIGAPPPAAEPAPPAPRPSENGRRPHVRVLVAEDNDDYRKVVAYLLRENGYKVLEAKDGLEGLRLARSQPVQLALLDFDMPGLNGYELIQQLRSNDETRGLRILMLTGAHNRAHLKGLDMGLEAFLEKPVSNEDLLAAVARAAAALPPESGPSAVEEAPATAEAPGAAQGPGPALLVDLETAGDTDLLIEEQKKEKEEEVGLNVLANDSPLVSRINKILIRAVELNASDIHVEPQEKAIVVRVRLNGALRTLCQLPLALAPQVAARLKIISNLVITERRRPQDGQIRSTIKGMKIEFRVSTIPSVHGEKVVLRILGRAKLKPGLDAYGLRPRDLEVMTKALQNPHGLLLVTGPTGSGKTTTLYTMIHMLNTPDVNIMTAEDPVEYELPGITQVKVRADIGLTFDAILRSFLRQDPDIMLVGEIRDQETADIAVKAAITGHLVLSTLHTNSAPASILRLAHIGIPRYLIADSVKLVVAQRLVRTLCEACRRPQPVSSDFASLLSAEERKRIRRTYESPGCRKCDQSGYAGRKALFEVMEVRNPEIRQLILSAQGMDVIAQQAVKEGMVGLRQAALEAVAAGDTSVSEALAIILSE